MHGHLPVLPDEVLTLLDPQPGRVMLDCTVGRGGHAELILPRLAPGGRYVALDMDPANAQYARQRLTPLAQEADVALEVHHANFREVVAQPTHIGLPHDVRFDGLLADLGFASNQMEDPERGLSFTGEAPLDMRLDPTSPLTAADLVNSLSQRELADVIYRYGEERLSRRIATKVVEARAAAPIQTTRQLADLVRRAYPRPKGGRWRIDPATRTFMALRIAVNAELQALEGLLESLPHRMVDGGRAAIISFHSLEDRLVKRATQAWERQGLAQRLNRKPITASEDELADNPRSRSAKLRGVRWESRS